MTSVNDKLNRVRKPRVHIKYDVETEGSQIERELPFVAGVIGDFSGNNTETKKPLKDRKFTKVDRDNFNAYMQSVSPGVKLRVDNKLSNDDSEMPIELKFNSMEDFEPTSIVNQVPALKQLFESRNKLRDLLSKADRSDKLESILEDALKNPDKLKSLASDLDAIDND